MYGSIKILTILSGLALGTGLVSRVTAADLTEYQRSVDKYRESYKIYEISRADYVNLGTFSAEEALIGSARNMLVNRAESWINYWQTTESNPDEGKWLTDHIDRLRQWKTRNEMVTEAGLLNEKKVEYLNKSFLVNNDIVQKKLIGAVNQVRQLNSGLRQKAESQNIDPASKESLLRGFGLNMERLNNLDTKVSTVSADFIKRSGYVSADQFSEITAGYQPLFSELVQYMQITRELAEQVQW